MADAALLPSLSARRTRARELIEELNDFATATGALEWLFEAPSDEKVRVLELILHWQNRHADDDLDAVVADFEAQDEDTSSHEDHSSAIITRDMVFQVMGKPALLFATSIYDEDLATLVWRGLVAFHRVHPQFNLLLQAMDNTRDSHGLSGLHYAVEAQMPEFMTEVCGVLARLDAIAFRRAIVAIRSQDIVLPMAAKQITGKSITSGGCTLLHLAVRKGDLDVVKLLVEAPVALEIDTVGTDWDGLTIEELALLHGRDDVASYLQVHSTGASPSSADRESLQKQRDECATTRYTASMVATAPMTRREVFTTIWTQHECEQVLSVLEKVTQRRGWSKQRHTSYPTTDLPCYQVASIDAWVRSSIRQRLFAQVYERYEIPITKTLTFRELFYVKYEARAGEQAELALHCDGSVLSFNILLNPREEFSGGGTYFEEADVTVHIDRGDAVVHSGKVRHAGAAVTGGKRTILVGFLDLVDRVAL